MNEDILSNFLSKIPNSFLDSLLKTSKNPSNSCRLNAGFNSFLSRRTFKPLPVTRPFPKTVNRQMYYLENLLRILFRRLHSLTAQLSSPFSYRSGLCKSVCKIYAKCQNNDQHYFMKSLIPQQPCLQR